MHNQGNICVEVLLESLLVQRSSHFYLQKRKKKSNLMIITHRKVLKCRILHTVYTGATDYSLLTQLDDFQLYIIHTNDVIGPHLFNIEAF